MIDGRQDTAKTHVNATIVGRPVVDSAKTAGDNTDEMGRPVSLMNVS